MVLVYDDTLHEVTYIVCDLGPAFHTLPKFGNLLQHG